MTNLEELRNKLANLKSGGSGNAGGPDNYLKVQDGKTKIRILPSKNEEESFYSEAALHYVSLGDEKVTFVCPASTGEGDCPVCSVVTDLWGLHNEQKKVTGNDKSTFREAASKNGKKLRYYMNVFDRDSEEVKIFSTGKKVFEKILTGMFEVLDEEGIDILDPEEGFDFVLNKEIIGDYPNYDNSMLARKASKLATSKVKIDEILGQCHNLNNLHKKTNMDEIRKIAQKLRMEYIPSETRPTHEGEPEEEKSNEIEYG